MSIRKKKPLVEEKMPSAVSSFLSHYKERLMNQGASEPSFTFEVYFIYKDSSGSNVPIKATKEGLVNDFNGSLSSIVLKEIPQIGDKVDLKIEGQNVTAVVYERRHFCSKGYQFLTVYLQDLIKE